MAGRLSSPVLGSASRPFPAFALSRRAFRLDLFLARISRTLRTGAGLSTVVLVRALRIFGVCHAALRRRSTFRGRFSPCAECGQRHDHARIERIGISRGVCGRMRKIVCRQGFPPTDDLPQASRFFRKPLPRRIRQIGLKRAQRSGKSRDLRGKRRGRNPFALCSAHTRSRTPLRHGNAFPQDLFFLDRHFHDPSEQPRGDSRSQEFSGLGSCRALRQRKKGRFLPRRDSLGISRGTDRRGGTDYRTCSVRCADSTR